MIAKQKKMMAGIILLILFGWMGSAWAIAFDTNALNNYSATPLDCFGNTSKTFWDKTGLYSLTVDHKDMDGKCNSGFDLIRLEDKNGVEIWSVNVEEGTAGDYLSNNWDTIFPDDTPSTVSTPTTLRISTSQIADMISTWIARIMMPRKVLTVNADDEQKGEELKSNRVSGLAAGDQPAKFGLWVNTGYADWDIDDHKTKSDGNLTTFIIGADYRVAEPVVFGISLAYENSATDTDYNKGWLDQDGITIAPYLGIIFNNYLAFSATVGYAWLDIDQKREKGSGHKVRSSLDSNRIFGSMRLNGFYNINRLTLTGTLGCLYAQERQESFTEKDGNHISSNNVDLGQASLGVEVSYNFDAIEPYLATTLLYDFQYEDVKNANYDDTSVEINPGVRFYMDNGFCADIQGGAVLGRNNYDEFSIIANLRYEF